MEKAGFQGEQRARGWGFKRLLRTALRPRGWHYITANDFRVKKSDNLKFLVLWDVIYRNITLAAISIIRSAALAVNFLRERRKANNTSPLTVTTQHV